VASFTGVDSRAPVIVGVAQLNRDANGDDPISLAAEAARAAADDAGPGSRLLARADSYRHVATISWPYSDEAALVAAAVGGSPRETVRTATFGGDGPLRLLSDTARSIRGGAIDLAVLTGAEAVGAVRAARRAGGPPDWPHQPSDASATRIVGEDRFASNEAELAVGLGAPVNNYALLETAIRARTGDDASTHERRIAALWSRFSGVAAENPHAKLRRRYDPDELLTSENGNRPVSAPYSKLLTANSQVDQATAVIVCSAEEATSLRVPRDRWVFVAAGAHATDEWFMTERADLASSPAIAAAGTAALAHAGLAIDDVAFVDLYSCFPSAVQIAASALGLSLQDPSRPLTLTGGLTFAGGPGNNYSSHGVAAVVGRLRDDPGSSGLTTALGWYATKHAVAVFSGEPPRSPYREIDANELIVRPAPRNARADYHGPATVEAYTIPYGRDGGAEAVIVSALTPDGERALTRSAEPEIVRGFVIGDRLGETLSMPLSATLGFTDPERMGE
jgi:acetyl-CoA C-acetyltransferase